MERNAIKRRRFSPAHIPGESKVHNQQVLAVLPIVSTIPVLINGVAAGTGRANRIGDVMTMTKIMIKFCAKATATSLNNCYRFIILFDKQANKALPTLDDIYNGGAPHNPRNFMELDARKRFLTVWNSKSFAVGANTNDNDNRSGEFFCDCRAETVWTGGGGTIASLVSGSLILVTISDAPIVASAATVSFEIRLRFEDGPNKGRPKFFNKKTYGDFLGN